MSSTGLVSCLWRPAGRLREVGWGDIARAILVAGIPIVLASCLAVRLPLTAEYARP